MFQITVFKKISANILALPSVFKYPDRCTGWGQTGFRGKYELFCLFWRYNENSIRNV
jgi:hypothetical protein